MRAMYGRLEPGLANCASIMAQATGFTTRGTGTRSFSCCAAETRGHKQMTSRQRSGLQKNGAKKVAEKFTIYDPAEDLGIEDGELFSHLFRSILLQAASLSRCHLLVSSCLRRTARE